MKLLITADGPTLESQVARRFGHATHFLTVDAETRSVLATYETKKMPAHTLVLALTEIGIRTILTGDIGPHAFQLSSKNDVRVAITGHMTVAEAIDRFNQGQLKILDAPTLLHAAEEHEAHRLEHRFQFGKGRGKGSGKSPFNSTTPRGRHHLQQFSGRGH